MGEHDKSVSPVSKCVFKGSASVRKDRCPVREKVVEGLDNLHERWETDVLGNGCGEWVGVGEVGVVIRV